MWNIKNLLLGLFMVILEIYAIRGIILTGKSYYYAGLILCVIITIAYFRNARR